MTARLKAIYTYACGAYCGQYGPAYCDRKRHGGRHNGFPDFVPDGTATMEQARAYLARTFKLNDVQVTVIRPETPDELTQRENVNAQEARDAARGYGWNMGGAN